MKRSQFLLGAIILTIFLAAPTAQATAAPSTFSFTRFLQPVLDFALEVVEAVETMATRLTNDPDEAFGIEVEPEG